MPSDYASKGLGEKMVLRAFFLKEIEDRKREADRMKGG